MNSGNPYESPEDHATETRPAPHRPRAIGTVVLVAGLVILAYGAVAFWLVNSLPPNGGVQGRLPSVYVMGVGLVVAVAGLIARDFRAGGKSTSPTHSSPMGIPALYGILGLVAIMVVLFLVISRL